MRWPAELTGWIDLHTWPPGTRVICRCEDAHPGAQLRFIDHDGHRLRRRLGQPVGALLRVELGSLPRPHLRRPGRLGAAELLAQGRSQAEVAQAVGVSRESVRRWQRLLAQGGAAALRRRWAGGRPPKLSDTQAAQVEQALRQGAKANGFATDLWTLDRVAQVIQRVTGVRLARASTWRLLVGRLGWSLQRPERQAREPDEEAIARWLAEEWPRINKGAAANSAWLVVFDESGSSLLSVTRRMRSPCGLTPVLRHRGNWKRASMAAALGDQASDADRGPRLGCHLQKDSSNPRG